VARQIAARADPERRKAARRRLQALTKTGLFLQGTRNLWALTSREKML
jgi:hypothetical protein